MKSKGNRRASGSFARRNLARYLVRHADPVHPLASRTPAERAALLRQDKRTVPKGVYRQAMPILRHLWQLSGGYFNNQEMPNIAWHKRHETTAGVTWRGENGHKSPVGINLDRSFARSLLGLDDYGRRIKSKQVRRASRSEVMRTLLHEWAHTNQDPALYDNYSRDRSDVEGGAEAFSFAVAPQIAKLMHWGYDPAPLKYSEYRPYVASVLNKHRMPWVMRTQFGR